MLIMKKKAFLPFKVFRFSANIVSSSKMCVTGPKNKIEQAVKARLEQMTK